MCDLPSFTEESNEAGKSVQNSTCKIISEPAGLQNQSLFDNIERERIVLDERSIKQNCETCEDQAPTLMRLKMMNTCTGYYDSTNLTV